jgi:hypothetical protein
LYTQHLDLAPTVLSLLDIESPEDWLGRNLCDAKPPPRSFVVELELSGLKGIVDNGLLYRLEGNSGKRSLMKIEQDGLVEHSASDAENALMPIYHSRLSMFEPWVVWRHYRRASQKHQTPVPAFQTARLYHPQVAEEASP